MAGGRAAQIVAIFTCLVACLLVLCSRQRANISQSRRLVSLVEQLGGSDIASRASDVLQEFLWDRNHISAVGEEAFLQWMRNGDVPVSRGMDVPPQELKPKLILRVLAFCRDVLPAEIIASYAEDMAEVQGIDFSKVRPLMFGEAVVKSRVHDEYRVHGHPKVSPFNYFSFMPYFLGRAVPGKGQIELKSRCWKSVTVECAAKTSTGWQLKVHASGSKKLACSETFALFSASHFHAVSFTTPIALPSTITFKADGLNESEVWDIETLGVRCFSLPVTLLEAVHNLFVTALLFAPEKTKGVTSKAAARNVDFVKNYVGFDMTPRSDSQAVALNESFIHSGDMFGIIRLDGLDPMLAWGMGSGTGHTVIALWENGQLYIAESQVNSSYWPTNGIQRTPYREWVEQAHKAGYNTVHLPLTQKYRDLFDVKQANAFFHNHEGLQYGYQALLSGWIDTEGHNYPCKPPYDGPADEKQCLVWEVLEVGVPIITRMIPSFEHPFVPAWNTHVTGSAYSRLTATQLYREARNKGMPLAQIPAVPESDDKMYPSEFNNGTKGPGLAMVCCVFVCRIWKAGGVFQEIGDDFNCVEQTNVDVYGLNIIEVDASTSPSCKRDPGNPLCQLTGDYVMKLPKAGTRHMYKHMQETCPTEPPLYARSDTC